MCVQMWREDGMCVSGTQPLVSAVEVLHPRSHKRISGIWNVMRKPALVACHDGCLL